MASCHIPPVTCTCNDSLINDQKVEIIPVKSAYKMCERAMPCICHCGTWPIKGGEVMHAGSLNQCDCNACTNLQPASGRRIRAVVTKPTSRLLGDKISRCCQGMAENCSTMDCTWLTKPSWSGKRCHSHEWRRKMVISTADCKPPSCSEHSHRYELCYLLTTTSGF